MYLVVFFDLPVKKKIDRKEYAKFRKVLLNDGFIMEQFSVYSRYCASQNVLDQHIKVVRAALPPNGGVKILTLTSKMFEKMEIFIGRDKEQSEKAPDVFTLY